MFQKLCGSDKFKNVVVLTTFWDQVGIAIGENREKQLQSKFFKTVVDGGGRFMRHDRTATSAGAVLSYVFAELAPVITQIQTEMGVEGKALVDTAAGSVQQEEIERIIAKHNEEVSSLMAEMETIKESNAAARRELEEERAQLQEQLARWETEKAALKEGIQEQVAQLESERAALKEGMDKESSARKKLEADLAAEKENREKWRQEYEEKFEARAKANAELAEERRRQEDRLREEERRRDDAEFRNEMRHAVQEASKTRRLKLW